MTLMKESKMVYNAFKSEIALLPEMIIQDNQNNENKKNQKKNFLYISLE